MIKNNSRKNYQVGYGKPPKEYQWKPGESGNPFGAPKKKKKPKIKPFPEALAKALSEPVKMHSGGEIVTVTLSEAIATKLAHDALKSPTKLSLEILKQLEKFGTFAIQAQQAEEQELEDQSFDTEEARRIIAEIKAEMGDFDEDDETSPA
jgi:hypothetical protein